LARSKKFVGSVGYKMRAISKYSTGATSQRTRSRAARRASPLYAERLDEEGTPEPD
jgi:hypothetical protein